MKINLICSNVSFGEEILPPQVQGETMAYNGLTYNFSPLLEGAEIEIGLPFTEPVRRKNGVIEVCLQYFYSTETADTKQSSNPEDYIFDVKSGHCPCPIKRKPMPAEPMEVENEQ